jgi:hypothetical protein
VQECEGFVGLLRAKAGHDCSMVVYNLPGVNHFLFD